MHVNLCLVLMCTFCTLNNKKPHMSILIFPLKLVTVLEKAHKQDFMLQKIINVIAYNYTAKT